MKKICILLTCALILITACKELKPPTDPKGWVAANCGVGVVENADGTLMIDGWYAEKGEGYGSGRLLIVKTDSNGNILFQKKTNFGSARSLIKTVDNAYVLTGDGYLMKADANGDCVWAKAYYACYDAKQTADNGFIIAGSTLTYSCGFYEDIYLIKVDTNGNFQWQKTFGGCGDAVDLGVDHGRSIFIDSDGGYSIAGGATSAGSHTNVVVKTDASGNCVWAKAYGSSADYSEASEIIQTSDGGHAFTTIFPGGLYKINSAGTLSWAKTWETTAGEAILQLNDDGFLIAGGSGSGAFIKRTDSSGNQIWNNIYSSGSFEDIIKVSDGNYVAVGMNGSDRYGYEDFDLLLVKININGTRIW